MIEGVPLRFGDREWTVPSLTLSQLKRLAPQIAVLREAGAAVEMTVQQIDALAEVVASALSRNYPETSAQSVLELLDVANAAEAYVAVLTGSGLKRGDAAEGRALGEERPVASCAETSPGSTERSPPAAAIPSPPSTL